MFSQILSAVAALPLNRQAPLARPALKQRYAGWTAYILTADLRLAKLIGLKASRRTPLYNGALECRLFEYRLVAGSMRRQKSAAGGN